MAQLNRISATLTPANITAITGALQTLQTNLPFLIGLSDRDRIDMPKMADKAGFHDKAKGYMGSNPEFLPGFVTKPEVDKDQTARDQFMQFWPLFQTVTRSVEDTFMVLNSELWMADLAYYQSVRKPPAGASRAHRRFTTTSDNASPDTPVRRKHRKLLTERVLQGPRHHLKGSVSILLGTVSIL